MTTNKCPRLDVYSTRWMDGRVVTSLEWYRGEDAGDLKRSELNELVEILTCLNALEGKIWNCDQKIVMDEKIVKNIVMNAKIDPKVVSPTKTLNQDVATKGGDIEPVGESRADVEMGNEEDEEPLEAEIPRVRMIQRIQQAEGYKNMKIQDMLSAGVGVLLASKAEVLVDNIELNYWMKRKEKGQLRS